MSFMPSLVFFSVIYAVFTHTILVYLPTFTIKHQPNVGEYAIHGSYESYGLCHVYPDFLALFVQVGSDRAGTSSATSGCFDRCNMRMT